MAVGAALAATVPAHASGSGQSGPVGIGVIGTALHVREVRATLDGWHAGERARVSLWRGGSRVKTVTKWKDTSSKQAAGLKYEIATWRINRRFPDGSQLCVNFQGRDQRACATIHS
ncbi:hypothetical protein [Streptomyces sp. NBC_01237]|uniref:hypothetical protein n=1 Tax=Streptomyces sp. NBC_01237 TaxID=2903790 RepID=UPI002DD9DDB8|nr:hypothetical protein [Streptomyces sp. NBC_01237]WRZ78733.1 hypothetical protein OG251_44720 [Streptomyces sp. NBC_01237]